MCVGDFNEVLEYTEKEGRAVRSESQMEGFRKVLAECQLSDLGFRGIPFTWSNHRQDTSFTKERLDRAVANREWCSLYRDISVYNLAAQTFDHCPIQVCFSNELESERFSYNRGFKFEEAWTHDSECMEVITDAWNDEGLGDEPMREVQRRLTSCQKALTLWSGRKFGNVTKQIKRKPSLLEELQRRENPALIADIKTLQAKLDELLAHEDIRWKQRAKQSWYQGGDRNTKYFHTWANQRRKTNSIW
jgi:hypothetical protein